MSNVIRFLERAGAAALFGDLEQNEYAAQIQNLALTQEQKDVLLGRDTAAISRMLDGRSTMYCMIVAPDGGEEREAPERRDDDEAEGEKEAEE